MYNNSLLNNYLYNYPKRPCLNTSPGPFITPCEALNRYMIDPCSIFDKNIIPISPMPPIPPIPPLPPIPMPPFPPGPMIGSRAQFRSPQALMTIGDQYPWNTEFIEGNAIEHIDGSTRIMLAPNTTFEYSFISLTTTGRDEEIRVSGFVLLIEAGSTRSVSENSAMGNGLNNILLQSNGRFTTRNGPVLLGVQFSIQSLGDTGVTEATLMLAEIL